MCQFWVLQHLVITILISHTQTTSIYEADLIHFNSSDYSIFLPNPPTVEIRTTYSPHSSPHKQTYRGIEVTMDPFVSNEAPEPFNHIQYLYGSPTLAVPPTTLFQARWDLSVQLNTRWAYPKPWSSGVSHKTDDPRLGTGGCVMIDPNTGVVASFFLTNTGIWAFSERLRGFGVQSFGQIQRIASRLPGDIHRLSFTYDPIANSLHWGLEDRIVASTGHVGRISTSPDWRTLYTLNTGEPNEVHPTTFMAAFALFEVPDFGDPWMAGTMGLISAGPGDASVYLYPHGWYGQAYNTSAKNYSDWCYGQRGTLKLFQMEVHTLER